MTLFLDTMAEEKTTKFRLGYALDPNKTASFMTPSLFNQAKDKGIELIQVHFTQPLIDQGPFDCILHKSYDPNFTNQFQQLRSLYPNIVIMDSPESIQQLHNRTTMLQVIDGLQISSKLSVATPKQVFVESHEQLSESLNSKSLHFPVIAKPLLANGSLGSHQMYLIFGEEGLRGLELNPPFVLQQFVNHDGVVFKVYVAGEHVMCVKRKSLPDILEEMVTPEMALPFSQISDSDVTDKDQSDESVEKRIEEAELPPDEFLSEVAGEMRKALGLNLFNFDMIRDGAERYLVIDINYFPGYAKVPGYETMLIGFFLDVMEKKNKQNGTCDGCACPSAV